MATSAGLAIFLDRSEKTLGDKLHRGELPFLGLYTDVFGPNARDYLKKVIALQPRPVDAYLDGLKKWPALFASYLTIHVVEGYGQNPNGEVHPLVDAAVLGRAGALSQAQRERLWSGYRRACVALGLAVSPRQSGANYMVDEYLRQAGVPLAAAGELVQRMARYARATGIPDDDDPGAIKLWQRGLLDTLGAPFPVRVRRAVADDDTGFYTRLFSKAYREPTAADVQAYALGRAFAAGFDGRGPVPGSWTRSLAIPRVLWRDGILGVELPAADGMEWSVEVGAQRHRYEGLSEPRFVPFEEDLPSAVTVMRSGGVVALKETLWEDRRENRLLVCSSGGAFVAGARLGQPGVVALEPGSYQLVLRFVPDGRADEVEQLTADPDCYGLECKLDPGEALELRRGPASVTLKADATALVALNGASVRDVRGTEVFLPVRLSLRIVLPSEWLVDGSRFEVQVSPGGLGESFTVPVAEGSESSVLDLAPHLRRLSPGLGRVLVELRRVGAGRALARVGGYLWNSLEEVRGRCVFACSQLPQNLDRSASENLQEDPQACTLTYADDGNRFFRTVFDLRGRGPVPLVWSVPGTFLYARDYQEGGVVERPLRKGVTLVATPATRTVLEVYADRDGVLELGGLRVAVPFARVGVKKLQVAALVDYLRPGEDTLYFRGSDEFAREALVRIVAPHEVLQFEARPKAGGYEVELTLPRAAARFRLSGEDLLTGRKVSVDLLPDDVAHLQDPDARAWVFSSRSGKGEVYTISVPLERWPAGFWALEVDVQVEGRWGHLTNKHADMFYVGLTIGEGGAWLNRNALLSVADHLSEEQALVALPRVHRLALVCHSPEAWEQLSWISDVWRRLVRRFDRHAGPLPREVVEWVGQQPPETAPASWVPHLSFVVGMPWVLGRPASEYVGAPPTQGGTGRALGLLPLFGGDLLRLFTDGVADPVAAVGFKNAVAMQRGARPTSFRIPVFGAALLCSDLSARLRLLRQEGWRPGRGDLLGALHYQFALADLKDRYRRTLDGTEDRGIHALFLLKQVRALHLASFGSRFPAHFDNMHGALGLLRCDAPESLAEAEQQEQENLRDIVGFLSLVAQVCRWEARVPGALTKLRETLQRHSGAEEGRLGAALSYLLYIGEEILGFYLLLWELAFASED